MRVLTAALVVAASLLTSGCHLIYPYHADPVTCPSQYDFNGTYRTVFSTGPIDTSKRIWGSWLSMQLEHTPIRLVNCQPMPNKSHPVKGTLVFYELYGAERETFVFNGSVDLGQPDIAKGTITKTLGNTSEVMTVKLTLSIKSKDPSLLFTLCNQIPNVPALPASPGPKVDWLEFEVLGSSHVARTALLEKCAATAGIL